jgi:hypothetical protein
MADELRQKPGGTGTKRGRKRVSEVAVGDVLLLDYECHMDEQPHTVLEIEECLNMFHEAGRTFWVRCLGNTFETCHMSHHQTVDVQLPEKEGQDAAN